MSFYNNHGFRVEESAVWQEEEKDYKRIYVINVEGLERKISGYRTASGETRGWETREAAERYAENNIEKIREFVRERQVIQE